MAKRKSSKPTKKDVSELFRKLITFMRGFVIPEIKTTKMGAMLGAISITAHIKPEYRTPTQPAFSMVLGEPCQDIFEVMDQIVYANTVANAAMNRRINEEKIRRTNEAIDRVKKKGKK